MKHVVVVEDDAINATLFRTLLERRAGCRVTVTESPEELMRLGKAGEIALVVMDVSLNNSTWDGKAVSGVDICKMFKSNPETASIPVVLATAHAMRGDAERLLLESGAEDYVAKPIVDHDAFVGLIRQWLGAEAA